MEKLIGREAERKILNEALASREAELIAVFGRRRVGKTFLIRSVYKGRMVFEISGIHQAKLSEQLENFSLALQKATGNTILPAALNNWIKALDVLQEYLSTRLRKEKSAIFLRISLPTYAEICLTQVLDRSKNSLLCIF
ncbi:MAG: hypothetical protein WKG06_47200 [Segetibacter sp.]